MTITKNELSGRILSILGHRGMTVTALASASGVSRRGLHKMMHAETRMQISSLGKIANALGYTIDELTAEQFHLKTSAAGNIDQDKINSLLRLCDLLKEEIRTLQGTDSNGRNNACAAKSGRKDS